MFLTIITLCRFYLMWRVFSSYSYWSDEKAENICHDCHAFGGTGFALKCELKERPYTILMGMIMISVFIFAFALQATELPYMSVSTQDWTYFWNSLWCTIITMTTVGYGDFYPTTYMGRLVGVAACLWGTFVISLMVVSLTISSEFSP
jgi:hypothetical protein